MFLHKGEDWTNLRQQLGVGKPVHWIGGSQCAAMCLPLIMRDSLEKSELVPVLYGQDLQLHSGGK